MESFQQFELILSSSMDNAPSKCSNTEDLMFGDNFANGKTKAFTFSYLNLMLDFPEDLFCKSLDDFTEGIDFIAELEKDGKMQLDEGKFPLKHAFNLGSRAIKLRIDYLHSTSGRKIIFCVIYGVEVASDLKISFVFKIQSKKTCR